MAQATSTTKIDVTVTLTLTENEARALNAIACYNFKAFLSVFYEHLGKSYLEPYQRDLESLFKFASNELPSHYQKGDEARKAVEQHVISKLTPTTNP